MNDHREEIEALLAALDRAGPAILRSLDNAIATTTAAIVAIDAVGGEPSEE